MAVLWTATAPNFPEELSSGAKAACGGILDLIGKFEVSKVKYDDVDGIGYHLKFVDFISIRIDDPKEGYIAFHGLGGCEDTLDDCLIKAFAQFEYFRGSTVCKPPRDIYGVLRSTRTKDIYGQSVEPINRVDDLNFVMQYAIGIVPPDFPASCRLLPMDSAFISSQEMQ